MSENIVWASAPGWPAWPAVLVNVMGSKNQTSSNVNFLGESTYVPLSDLETKPIPFVPFSSGQVKKSLSNSVLTKTYRSKLVAAIVDAIDRTGVVPPNSLPKEILSNLSSRRRKSSRSRTSRLIQVGNHSVLRENDYDMEDGITTFSGSSQSKGLRAVVRARSAFELFRLDQMSSVRASVKSKSLAATQREIARRWKTADKKLYERRAKLDRKRYDRECAAVIASSSSSSSKTTKTKKKSKKRRKKKLPNKSRPQKLNRTQLTDHNKKMRSARSNRLLRRNMTLRSELSVLTPFITLTALKSIKKSSNPSPSSSYSMRVAVPSNVQSRIQNGELRDYQVRGLNWLVKMHHTGMNCILADEMGLGKTIQTIAFLSYLKHDLQLQGPSLVVVPLSVISNWVEEIKRWAPDFKVLRLHSSNAEERERIKGILVDNPLSIDVVVTTYEMMVSNNTKHLLSSRIVWRYVIIDEGHKVKNENTNISNQMLRVQSEGRILLTGTPLQNNLHELWALLCYLHHDIFSDSSHPFDDAFDLTRHQCNDDTLSQAHYLLRLFQLRRLKAEVELTMPKKLEMKLMVGLSEEQKFWAKQLIFRDAGTLIRAQDGTNEEVSKNVYNRLSNLLMQLRKVCNHPWMMPNVDYEDDEKDELKSLVNASEKMKLLDRLLGKLRAKNHRVVIFSQFTAMLDILESYLTLKNLRYARLDGGTSRVRRSLDIRVFNAKNSKIFCYLMSTRAGGLGINLQTADTVILYDSDWNPQVDLQAMARVHRIGQKKLVHVYRFVTENTVEERVLLRAEKKLYLDKMVNRDSTQQAMEYEKLGVKEMLKLLRFGANAVFSSSTSSRFSDKDLNQLIRRDKNDFKDEKQRHRADKFEAQTAPLDFRNIAGLVPPGTKKSKSLSDISNDWLKTKKKRARKSRTVNVDGYSVLRENMDKKKIVEATQKKTRVKKKYIHESFCLICWDGGKLLCCDLCPASYHKSCLQEHGYVFSLKTGFKCPHHNCVSCGRGNGQAGGVLLRCTECPMAYCEDCEPKESTNLDSGECNRFLKLGMAHPNTAFYMQCSDHCKRFYKSRRKHGIERALAIQRKEVAASTKGKKTSDTVKYVEPPSAKICKRKAGKIWSDGTWEWYIANQNDSCSSIARKFHMDAAKIVHNNRCVDGLTLNAMLLKGTPLFLREAPQKNDDNERCVTPTSVFGSMF